MDGIWVQEGIEKEKQLPVVISISGRSSTNCLKHLQSKKGDKSYPSQPSTVVKMEMIIIKKRN